MLFIFYFLRIFSKDLNANRGMKKINEKKSKII